MKWILEDRHTGVRPFRTQFESPDAALSVRTKMGPVLAARYRLVPILEHGDNPKWAKILTEGLVRGDLRDILLPRISVDEYLPADPNTDNIVLAFFIKGVPEAVLPFKNFCENSNGVMEVDFGDSETIPNCSIVYVEMNRDRVKVEHIDELIEQVGILTNLKPSDFTLTFPNTDEKFAYSSDVLHGYFRSRSKEKNIKAQKQAQQGEDKTQTESLTNHLVSLFLNS